MRVEFKIKQRRMGRAKLLLLVGVFLAPVVVGYTLYGVGWQSNATVNYGELIQPVRPVSDVSLRSLDGRAFRFDGVQRKWTMVYLGSAECLKSCEAALYKMQQVHLAQGRQANRVQRVFIVTDNAALDMLRYKVLDYPGTHVLTGVPDAIKAIKRQFAQVRDRTYLVDPLGNIVMGYSSDADPSGMRKDLSRLLRASQVG